MESTVIAAFISGLVALIGILVTLLRNNKQDKAHFNLLQKDNEILKDNLEDKHTLIKAQEYHNLTMKEFDSNRERLLDTKEEIKDVSSLVGGISTDIKLMSKDIENHVLNLKELKIQEPNFIQALKVLEGYAQELGEAKIQIKSLENEKRELISQYEKQVQELKLKIDSLEKDNYALNEQNKKLSLQCKDTFEKDDFDLEL